MDHIISVFLSQGKKAIVKGLQNGDLVRIGGTIRKAAGTPGAGQIVTFLKEVSPSLIQTSLNPVGSIVNAGIGLVDLGVNIHGHYKTHGLLKEGFETTQSMIVEGFETTQNMISDGFSATNGNIMKVMGLTSVGAATSVMNLGLTAVSFYFLNKKLNKIQENITSLAKGIDKINDEMKDIKEILIELKYLMYINNNKLEDVIFGIGDIKQLLFEQHIAIVKSSFDTLQKISGKMIKKQHLSDPEKNDILSQLNKIKDKRFIFSERIENIIKENKVKDRLLELNNYYRAWSFTSVAEIQGNRLSNHIHESATISSEIFEDSRKWTNEISNQLINKDEFGGLYRFGYSRFNNILLEEQKNRLYNIYSDSIFDIRKKEFEASNSIIISNKSDDWIQEQTSIASVLDMWQEITNRFESLKIETNFCSENYLDYNNWESMPIDNY